MLMVEFIHPPLAAKKLKERRPPLPRIILELDRHSVQSKWPSNRLRIGLSREPVGSQLAMWRLLLGLQATWAQVEMCHPECKTCHLFDHDLSWHCLECNPGYDLWVDGCFLPCPTGLLPQEGRLLTAARCRRVPLWIHLREVLCQLQRPLT